MMTLTPSRRSPLSCRNHFTDLLVNQWTGFYMIGTSVMKDLKFLSSFRFMFTDHRPGCCDIGGDFGFAAEIPEFNFDTSALKCKSSSSISIKSLLFLTVPDFSKLQNSFPISLSMPFMSIEWPSLCAHPWQFVMGKSSH